MREAYISILAGLLVLSVFAINDSPFENGQSLVGNAFFSKCNDSDGGIKYNLAGVVTYNFHKYVDVCSGNYLKEYYCFSNMIMTAPNYLCPNGCTSGKCNPAPVIPVTLISSNVPNKINLGQEFTISCQYSAKLQCNTALHDSNLCVFIGSDLSPDGKVNYTFKCKAESAGIKENLCARWTIPGDSACIKDESINIAKTTVVDMNRLPIKLMSSSAPEEIALSDKFTIKCDFGEAVGCFTALSNSKICDFKGLEGTTGLFECASSTTGMAKNYCATWIDNSIPGCSQAQMIQIQGTDVISNSDEIIDTLDYFLSNNPDKPLEADKDLPLSLRIKNNTAQYIKWPGGFEYYKWDNNFLYLLEDASPVNPYAMSPGVFMKRNMAIGEKIDMAVNDVTYYKKIESYDNAILCVLDTQLNQQIEKWPYINTLIDHQSIDLEGDLGLQDVIVLKAYSTIPTYPDFEKFYYSKEYGWVRWENWHKNGSLQAIVTFNKFSANPPLQRIDYGCSFTP